MLARELGRLRLAMITATPEQAEALAARHEDVATWTDTLLQNLSDGMRYDKRPLAVLGLSRRMYFEHCGLC